MTQFLREPIIRHDRRDGPKMWPERALSLSPADVLAEVDVALSRRRRRRAAPKPRPAAPLVPKAQQRTASISNAAAARACGISPAAMLKRTRKFGLNMALAMGGRNDNAKKDNGHVVM
jgi:hypothetical protein